MILKNLISEQQYKETAIILYEARKNKPFNDFLLYRRIATIAALMCNKGRYISYHHFLRQLNKAVYSSRQAKDFFAIANLAENNSTFFGIDANTVLYGSIRELETEILREYEKSRQ